jgi:hypothetical protein
MDCVKSGEFRPDSGEFRPDSGDLRGGLVTVGAETSACQRLAWDSGQARFGCEFWEYVGWREKFGGACKKFAGRRDLQCLFRAFFCPEPANRRLFCSLGLFGGSARVALTLSTTYAAFRYQARNTSPPFSYGKRKY